MPRYVPPKDSRGPQDGDAHIAERLLAHTEETLHELERSVAGPPPLTDGRLEAALGAPEIGDGGPDDARVRQFLYMVTHDLQSPLSAMSLRLGLLERHLAKKDIDGICKDVTMLNDAYGRMRDLVQGILVYAETGGASEEDDEVALDDLAAAALHLLRDEPALACASVALQPLPVVRGQPQALGRLFQNLIGNAVKYRHPDRPLQLTVDAATDHTGAVVVTFADNGVGFEPSTAATLFAPFVRGQGATRVPGHGLGLASCARIASDHGATIEALGRPGEGATFRVRIPAERVVSARTVTSPDRS